MKPPVQPFGLILLPLLLIGQTGLKLENIYNLNGIRFRLDPHVQFRLDQLVYQSLEFPIAAFISWIVC